MASFIPLTREKITVTLNLVKSNPAVGLERAKTLASTAPKNEGLLLIATAYTAAIDKMPSEKEMRSRFIREAGTNDITLIGKKDEASFMKMFDYDKMAELLKEDFAVLGKKKEMASIVRLSYGEFAKSFANALVAGNRGELRGIAAAISLFDEFQKVQGALKLTMKVMAAKIIGNAEWEMESKAKLKEILDFHIGVVVAAKESFKKQEQGN